jgi:excisionase family DNA binding protein
VREEKLLTLREVSLFLGISEKEIMDLAEKGIIPAYKIGGVYLRFKYHQIEAYQRTARPLKRELPADRYSLKDRLGDFFYFNDFYLVAILLIAVIIFVITKG